MFVRYFFYLIDTYESDQQLSDWLKHLALHRTDTRWEYWNNISNSSGTDVDRSINNYSWICHGGIYHIYSTGQKHTNHWTRPVRTRVSRPPRSELRTNVSVVVVFVVVSDLDHAERNDYQPWGKLTSKSPGTMASAHRFPSPYGRYPTVCFSVSSKEVDQSNVWVAPTTLFEKTVSFPWANFSKQSLRFLCAPESIYISRSRCAVLALITILSWIKGSEIISVVFFFKKDKLSYSFKFASLAAFVTTVVVPCLCAKADGIRVFNFDRLTSYIATNYSKSLFNLVLHCFRHVRESMKMITSVLLWCAVTYELENSRSLHTSLITKNRRGSSSGVGHIFGKPMTIEVQNTA